MPSMMYVTVSKPRWGCHGVPFGSPGAYSTSPIWSMWMKGSRSARSTPAKARRTGKPSPSNPLGALVMPRTPRSTPGPTTMRGRTVRSGTVMAGMATSRGVVADSTIASVTPREAPVFPGRRRESAEQLEQRGPVRVLHVVRRAHPLAAVRQGDDVPTRRTALEPPHALADQLAQLVLARQPQHPVLLDAVERPLSGPVEPHEGAAGRVMDLDHHVADHEDVLVHVAV